MADTSLPYTLVAGAIENVNQVQANDEALRDGQNDISTSQYSDGSVTNDKLDATTVLDKAGVTSTSVTRRGKKITATEETTTSTSYVTLTTADTVANITVPTDGVLYVQFQAMWKAPAGAGKAAIFIGANQLKDFVNGAAAPAVQEATSTASSTDYATVSSYIGGLEGSLGTSIYTGDVTTGQAHGFYVSATNTQFGGWCQIDNLAAGTYDISIKFLTSSGTLTAKNRRLKVKVEGF